MCEWLIGFGGNTAERSWREEGRSAFRGGGLLRYVDGYFLTHTLGFAGIN